jgi:hypothetical protein
LAAAGSGDGRDVLIKLEWMEDGLTRAELARRYEALKLPIPSIVASHIQNAIEADVKRFLAEALIVRYDDLQMSTRLQQDLGVVGPKGAAIMAEFAERFAIDMNYFQPEGYFPTKALLARIFRLRTPESVQITIGQLVEAARSKRWTDSR